MRYAFTLDGRTHHVLVEEHADGPRIVIEGTALEPEVEAVDKGSYEVTLGDDRYTFHLHSGRIETDKGPLDISIRRARPEVVRAGGKGRAADGRIKPPMPGKIVEVAVAVGDTVDEGTTLVVLEAMKMQNDIKSPIAGTVAKVHVQTGQNVEAGAVLVEVEQQKDGEAAP